MKLVNSIDGVEVERFDGFCAAPLGYFRETKIAYFGFLTEYTMELIRQVDRKLSDRNATSYLTTKHLDHPKPNAVTWKYLRKFAFNTMMNEQLNIPESVADFIQGRVPKSVDARHYMGLKRKSIQFYPRYAQYITKLRQKANN